MTQQEKNKKAIQITVNTSVGFIGGILGGMLVGCDPSQIVQVINKLTAML